MGTVVNAKCKIENSKLITLISGLAKKADLLFFIRPCSLGKPPNFTQVTFPGGVEYDAFGLEQFLL